ncbi:Amidase [Apiospora rasikravindrae]|uniref:Amidase n=1 Tax=Apiospora rasikravindrae TaxID=990691 RepID=A0ABR1TF52_9PEZI
MSRNVRPKAPTTPVKASKKRRGSDSSSSLDLSDEEGGYSGVDAITDSEDEDEDDVVAAEEEQILVNEWRTTAHSSPRPIESESDDEGDDEDEAEEEEDDDEDDNDDNSDESASWEGFMSDGNQDAAAEMPATKNNGSMSDTTVERRVRFDVPDSDGDTTDTDDGVGFFPDIFVDQNSLDPSFRREIEQDDPDDSSNSGGFWDIHGPHDGGVDVMSNFADGDLDFFFEDDSTPVATPGTGHEPSTGVSTPVASPEKFFEDDNSLDGYQSDGDTTEDEAPPERPPSSLRRLDLSPEQFNFPFYEPISQSSPLLSNSGNLMMGAMFSSNTFGDFMNSQPVGPMEAFFPHTNDNTAVEDEDEESSDDELDEDEEESKLNVDDFVDLGDGSSDEEDVNAIDETEDIFSPQRPTTTNNDVTSLLSHFENNSNIVGAFRRDQANSQLIRNGKATRESLAFSSPYFEGTLRGIKDGRLTDTNIPISPLRKHKKKSSVSESPLSSTAQKRKASSEQHLGHKRQRSIPDVELLHI